MLSPRHSLPLMTYDGHGLTLTFKGSYALLAPRGQPPRDTRVEIAHVQGQRNPRQTVGTEAAVRRYPTSKG